MIHVIKDKSNSLLDYILDDPVRPNLSVNFRVSPNRMVIAMTEKDKPDAIVCVSLHDFVPKSVAELEKTSDEPNTAIFYTIWSYKKGSGAELIFKAVDALRAQYPGLTRFVTLSPKSEMARKFHLKNGAVVFQENEESVNYEYYIG